MSDLERVIDLAQARMRSLPMYSVRWYELSTARAECVRKWRLANTLRPVQ